MKIKCLHGYFIFEETRAGQVSEFMSHYQGLSLTPVDNYFTFTAIANAPEYSLTGADFLGATATKSYEGKPWEIFKQNGFVYNFNTDSVVSKLTITQRAVLDGTANYFISNGLIMPGAVMDDGSRVIDYSAWHLSDKKYKYSEVTFE